MRIRLAIPVVPVVPVVVVVLLGGGAYLRAAAPPLQDAVRTIWDGVYTPQQAQRGEQVYKRECSYCHRDDLRGGFFDNGVGNAPPLTAPGAFGSSFGERWTGVSVGEMVATIAAAMPQQKPASLTVQAYVDLISFLLSKNDVPAGTSELPVDVSALADILITVKP